MRTDTVLSPVDAALARAARYAEDGPVRRWLRALLRRGETAAGGELSRDERRQADESRRK